MSDTASNDEDALLRLGGDLVAPAEIKSAGTTEVVFDGLLSSPIKLHEDLKNGCGGQLWPAGMVLAKYLLRKHRDSLQNKTILEIGAGGGLVGLAVAGGCSGFQVPIHITDQVVMLELMEQNISLNSMQESIRATVYDWGEPTPLGLPSQPDILLAADCVYYEPAFPLLHKTLLDLIGPQTVCYFCFKKRRRADMNCIKTIKKTFDVAEVPDDPDMEIYRKESIFLLKVQQKRK